MAEKAVRVWEFENEFLDPVSGNVTYSPHLGTCDSTKTRQV